MENNNVIRDLLDYYFRRWYLFVIGVIIALAGAWVYLRYSTNLYKTEGTVIIKDEKSGGASELAAFSDLGGLLSRFESSKLENELAIFKSKRIIGEVLSNLKLNIVYELVGTVKTSELYAYRPIKVQYLSLDESSPINVPPISIEIVSETNFTLSVGDTGGQEVLAFGQPLELSFGTITIIPNLDDKRRYQDYVGKIIKVSYRNIEGLASNYQNRLNVSNFVKNSNVVSLGLESPVPAKAEDFINELVYQYNQDAINDRSQIAKKTSDFIDTRLEIITRELDSVETDKETFKSSNRLTNIEAEAQLILQNASEFEKRQFDVNTQLELANSMIEYMEQSSNNDLLPSNLGITDESVKVTVDNYNSLILERNRLLKSSTAKNPVVVNMSNQIESIRTNILESLRNTTNALKASLRDLNFQESELNVKLSTVPTKEKIFRGIERQQLIKEQLYLFLLQQREEASISLAATSPRAKIVDKAFSSKSPVSPNRMLIYLGAGLMGLVFPFLFLYSQLLLRNKVYSRKDVESMIKDVSIIGELPKLKKGDGQLIEMNDRSILAESFRILRTNLQYVFSNKVKSKETPVIFVTSTIKGEGKTFVAFNLALTISLTGKRVVLVGGDIRNPQLQRYLSKEKKDKVGLTEYLIGSTQTVDELVETSIFNDHLDVILSGAIPPNPAEILMEPRMDVFFEELKKRYDYIIMDTAPCMLVTDTLIISKYADSTLYVVRANYTEKKLLEYLSDTIEDGRLSNVSCVLNNVAMSNFGYGNKYGYTYTSEKISWKDRLFKR